MTLGSLKGAPCKALYRGAFKIGPFEGHTKKWFIHWLPQKLYFYFLKDDKQSLSLVKNALFLRWPWELKSYFNKYFNSVNNLVNLRLKYDVFSEEYSKKRVVKFSRVFCPSRQLGGNWISCLPLGTHIAGENYCLIWKHHWHHLVVSFMIQKYFLCFL